MFTKRFSRKLSGDGSFLVVCLDVYFSEDDLPVVFLRIAHVDLENEAPWDVHSSASETSGDKSEDEIDDSEDYSNLHWSSRIQALPDVEFYEEVGYGIKVNMADNSTCLVFLTVLHQ